MASRAKEGAQAGLFPPLLGIHGYCQQKKREWLHRLSQGRCSCCYCLVTKLCLTLCDPMGSSLPGSSVHGISQARTLESVYISFSRRSSWPGIKPMSPTLAGWFFTTEPPSCSYQGIVYKTSPSAQQRGYSRYAHSQNAVRGPPAEQELLASTNVNSRTKAEVNISKESLCRTHSYSSGEPGHKIFFLCRQGVISPYCFRKFLFAFIFPKFDYNMSWCGFLCVHSVCFYLLS